MSRWLKLIEAAQGLNPDSKEADVAFAALDAVLLLEGPPAEPVPGLSEDLREGFVRTGKTGAIRSYATTWLTGPWRCLLLEAHTIAMGRPITLPGKEDQQGPSRTITDSRSQRFMTLVENASRSLGVAEPLGEGSIHAFCGSHWSFVAWRPREEDEPFDRRLRGDVDNYSKCYLDALQRARILVNDRGVMRLTVTKEIPEAWIDAPTPLWSRIEAAAAVLRDKGHDYAEIKAELVLTHAQMEMLFEDYQAPARTKNRVSSPKAKPAATVDDQALQQALKAIEKKKGASTYGQALKALAGPPNSPTKAAFRQAVADLASAAVLTPGFTTSAIPFGMDRRTLMRLLSGHPKALKAASKAAQASKEAHQTGRQALPALDRAQQRVAAGEDFGLVVAEEGVNPGSLQSRIQRAKKKA